MILINYQNGNFQDCYERYVIQCGVPFAFHNITVVTADNCISMKTDETYSELSRLVWEPILFKQYQTMSGYCTDTKNFQSPLNLYEFVPPSKKLIPPVHS